MNRHNCQTIINGGIDQLIRVLEEEQSALERETLGAIIRSEIFCQQWQMRGEIRLFIEWHVLQPHKRFRPGTPITPNGFFRKCSNLLARHSHGYRWLQALEGFIEKSGVTISTEYFTGGLSTATTHKILIRPWMTTRGRFHCLMREYAYMKLHPNDIREFDSPDEETLVQAVAYAVARAVGLESRYHSLHYTIETGGNAKWITDARQTVSDLATEILIELFNHCNDSANQ